MPKVHHRRARKDYPEAGIAAGEMYYYTKMKTGPRSSRELRSKTPFRRSQLTNSPFLSQVYDIEDSLAAVSDLDGANMVADDLETLAQECQESFDNMPEGLQQGDTGQMLEQRQAGCEAACEAIRELTDSWDEDTVRSEAEDEGGDPDEAVADALETLLEQIREVTIEY